MTTKSSREFTRPKGRIPNKKALKYQGFNRIVFNFFQYKFFIP